MQQNSKLVEVVVRTVLQVITDKEMQKFSSVKLPEILILASRKSEGFRQMEEKFIHQARIVAMDELSGDELADQQNRFARIIIPSLCPVGMADLALGRATGREMITLLGLLLKGYNVEVGSYEYQQYRDTSPPSLYKLYRQYEKRLEQFGLRTLAENRYPATQHKTPVKQSRLVTEAVLMELAKKDREIELPKEALITSLARDYARENGITLKIQG